MIKGYISEDLEPIIEIELIDENHNLSKINAVVDTGFTGYLCLSENLVEKMRLEYLFTDNYELANGKIVEEDVFAGNVIFDNKKEDVSVILSKSEDNLIGACLLKNKKVTINYVTKEIEIEIENSPLEEFESLADEGRKFAYSKGLKPKDVPSLINRVRRQHRISCIT
ncbi:MAG: clan AA aspartic protease [Nitrospirota bacterium]